MVVNDRFYCTVFFFFFVWIVDFIAPKQFKSQSNNYLICAAVLFSVFSVKVCWSLLPNCIKTCTFSFLGTSCKNTGKIKLNRLFEDCNGSFTLSDCDCESNVAINWVLLVSVQLFTPSDVTHQRKILRLLSQSLRVNRPLNKTLLHLRKSVTTQCWVVTVSMT